MSSMPKNPTQKVIFLPGLSKFLSHTNIAITPHLALQYIYWLTKHSSHPSTFLNSTIRSHPWYPFPQTTTHPLLPLTFPTTHPLLPTVHLLLPINSTHPLLPHHSPLPPLTPSYPPITSSYPTTHLLLPLTSSYHTTHLLPLTSSHHSPPPTPPLFISTLPETYAELRLEVAFFEI